MFIAIFLLIWTALHMYVFWRAASVPLVANHVSPVLLLILGTALWTSFLLPRFLRGAGWETIMRPIDVVGMTWLGILFLLFVCFLAVDLVTVFGLPFRGLRPHLRSIAFVAGLVLSLIAFVEGFRAPVVNDYEVRIPGLSARDDGLVVAVISDLHAGSLPGKDWLAARVAQVNALHPDLVLILGDILEGDGNGRHLRDVASLFRELSAPLGVWGVTGNHEVYSGIEASVRLYEANGIRMLRNEWREVRPGLVLGGVDDGRHFGPSGETRDRLLRTLAAKPPNGATIFLSHRPEGAEPVADSGVDLMLCGHTHGGQIWPFTYIAAMTNSLLAGRYEVNGMPVIVSRGTGTWGPRTRLWSPGEILRITLRAPSDGITQQ